MLNTGQGPWVVLYSGKSILGESIRVPGFDSPWVWQTQRDTTLWQNDPTSTSAGEAPMPISAHENALVGSAAGVATVNGTLEIGNVVDLNGLSDGVAAVAPTLTAIWALETAPNGVAIVTADLESYSQQYTTTLAPVAEYRALPEYRRTTTVAGSVEYRALPEYRRTTTLAIMVEYRIVIELEGVSNGVCTVSGDLDVISGCFYGPLVQMY